MGYAGCMEKHRFEIENKLLTKRKEKWYLKKKYLLTMAHPLSFFVVVKISDVFQLCLLNDSFYFYYFRSMISHNYAF